MAWTDQIHSADLSQGIYIFLGAYLLGCVTTGYYLVRSHTGQDIREVGSGNVGGRNVGRVLGRRGFAVTVLADGAKGTLAVWAAQQFTAVDWVVTLAMLAVVAGHMWPVQLRFQGGKGVATAVGAFLVYDFRLATAFGLLCLGGFLALRKTIVSALLAFVCLPLISLWLNPSGSRAVGLAVLASAILLAHRKNLLQESTSPLEPSEIAVTDPPSES